jgi:hypothetical protein
VPPGFSTVDAGSVKMGGAGIMVPSLVRTPSKPTLWPVFESTHVFLSGSQIKFCPVVES